MRKRVVLIGAGGLAAAILIAVLFGGGEERNPQGSQGFPALSAEAFARIEDFTYTSSRGGRTEWEAHSEAAEWIQARQRVLFENGSVRFYTEDGRVLGLFGKRGELDTETQNVRVEGNIIATSDDGYRLLTNALTYDSAAGVVSTNDPILFFGDQISLAGVGLDIHVKEERVRIGGRIEGTIWGLRGASESAVGFGGIF